MRIYNFSRGARGLRLFWQCEEMGLAYEPVLIPFPLPADYLARNPAGGVPFLEDDGGVAINESVAMMIYVEQRYGPTPLLPVADPAAFAEVLRLVVLSEATMGARLNTLMEAHFVAPADQKRNWSVETVEQRLAHTLGFLVERLGERRFLVGDDITLADIAVCTGLGIYKGALGGEIPAPLAAWRDRLMERPPYQRAQAKAAG